MDRGRDNSQTEEHEAELKALECRTSLPVWLDCARRGQRGIGCSTSSYHGRGKPEPLASWT